MAIACPGRKKPAETVGLKLAVMITNGAPARISALADRFTPAALAVNRCQLYFLETFYVILNFICQDP